MIIHFDFAEAHITTNVKSAVAEVMSEKSAQNHLQSLPGRMLHSIPELADFERELRYCDRLVSTKFDPISDFSNPKLDIKTA